jgi:hypothetical protein
MATKRDTNPLRHLGPWLVCLLLSGLLAAVSRADDWRAKLPPKEKVADYLQAISLNVKARDVEGSGVVKTREINGKQINFVWTAAHVVEELRSVREVIDPRTGTRREKVSFADAQVLKELVEGGRRVGELKMDAEVFRYSADEDLAILRIRKTGFVEGSVVFYEGPIPSIGTDLFHVGSLLGQTGANSMTSGIVSQIGRVIEKKEFDQSTCVAFPGSSGGGVYTRDGGYVGCLVRGTGEGFNLSIPVRRIRLWAERVKVLWLIDDSVAIPSDWDKQPVEDPGATFRGVVPASKAFPFLIGRATPSAGKSD